MKKLGINTTRILAGLVMAFLIMVNIQISLSANGNTDLNLDDISLDILSTASAQTMEPVDCGIACRDFCGIWSLENCTYTHCLTVDGEEETVMCMGEWQFEEN